MTRRLLVLCERVSNDGGIETYLRTILPALAIAGWKIRVGARVVDDADAYGVPAEQVAWSDEHDDGSATAAARIAEIAREFRPDVIAMHGVLDADVLEAARAAAPRAVYHLHDHRLFCPNGDRVFPQGGGRCRLRMGSACIVHSLVHGCAYGPRPATRELLRRRERVRDAAKTSDAFVVFSGFMRSTARANGIDGPVYVLQPPLEHGWIATAPAPRPQRDVVLFAGRVFKSKGIESLVRALHAIDAARRPLLRIAGDGPDLDRALRLARSLECATQPLGRLDRAALRDAVDDATIVAVPSLSDEPFALVGIEAFGRGRPVAAYAAGGIPEWVGDGGIAVRTGDEPALARAICDLSHAERWLDASSAALAVAARHGVAPHVRELEAAYAGTAS